MEKHVNRMGEIRRKYVCNIIFLSSLSKISKITLITCTVSERARKNVRMGYQINYNIGVCVGVYIHTQILCFNKH